ncbi:dihydroorotase [Alcanivorax sp. 1008]|uniref:dihydroorotase n=1 Tax=Alcanivorax sp. 1008 TaxID=2816853 RepID=UPI001E11380C|nr:dihydroorotase [Alcanivorax sp. 1008]MCC1495927.1 dihydroorotase [Alcanivorax sp. 1008]
MNQKAHLLIRKGRVIDPNTGRDEVLDILIENGRLVRIAASLDAPGAEIINAEGMLVLPGLVDTCVHLSESSGGRNGSIASEALAAASAGITHLCAQPDTNPVIDNAAIVRLIRERSFKSGFAKVLPLAAMTQGLEGRQLAEMVTLKEAGCIGVSNAGKPLQDTLVMKRCFEYAATFDIPVMLRPQDAALSAGGCAHDGPVASRLGLPGIPAVAETIELSRALLLCETTGVRLHIQQISCAASAELLRDAKRRGLPVTADVSIHHLLLDESALENFNSDCHIIPPLRSRSDRDALLAAVADGTIDAVCSQHLPLGSSSKQAPFPATKAGISGIETLLPLMLLLVEKQALTLPRAIELLTSGPARCLGQQIGHLEIGRAASLCVVDMHAQQTHSEHWLSAGKNSPWIDTNLPGAVRLTVCEGKVSWLSD